VSEPSPARPARPARSEASVGVVQAIIAYGLWGLMPLLFAAMAPAGAFEIVAWRIVFGLVFCAIAIAVTRSWLRTRSLIAQRRVMLVMGLAAVLILVNWTVYVAATTTGHTVEAALGYFINPLVTIALGVVVLRERLRPAQWAAVGISVVAVVVIAVGYGQMPWISLALAFSFGLYGLVKKRVGRVDAVSGLTLETAWLAPVAAVQLAVVGATSGLAYGSAGWYPTLMLTSAGVGTAIPLLAFAASTRRLPLSVVGFLQYLAPILQLAIGVLVLHEPMPAARWIGFVLVWIALVVLVAESLAAARRSRLAAATPVTGPA
jgi:chloramphenicol-sensitive protein RarD